MAKNGLMTFVVIMGVLCLVALTGLGIINYIKEPTPQEIIPVIEGSDTPIENVGDPATMKVFAYDQVSASNDKVDSPLYAWKSDKIGTLIADATTLSTSSRTSVSANIGDNVNLVSFNNSYYGDVTTVLIDKSTKDVDVSVYKVAEYLNSKIYDDGTALTLNINANLTLGASQTSAFDKLYIENNDTYSSFNLKGIGADMVVATNISDFKVNGMNEGQIPKRLRSSLDYYFELGSAQRLDDFDSWESGQIEVTMDADGCATHGEEATLYIIDEQKFKSVASTTKNQILSGVEDDSSSNNDVGTGDFTYKIGCTA